MTKQEAMRPLAQAVKHLEKGDWEKAHAIVQEDESRLSCWLHGIVHMMEGDEGNARYWYRRAKRAFPKEASIEAELRAARRAIEEENPSRREP